MASKQDDRSLARRGREVSGPVEDYEPRPQYDDDPSPEDIARFDREATCPKCGTTLYDDAAECWKCNTPVMGGTGGSGVPLWAVWVAVGLVMLFLLGYMASVMF